MNRHPAFWKKGSTGSQGNFKAYLNRIFSILGPVAYVIAVLVLFQFVSVQLVLGYYEKPLYSSSISLTAQEDAILADARTAKEKWSQASSKAAIGLPVRLEIPSIHVNAVIRHVGLAPDGSMGVPKLPRETAWYKLGPKPGEKGSAVIAGHLNWLYGARGAFERLKNLKSGDRIVVQDGAGVRVSFVVRSSRLYGKNEDASGVFLSDDGKSHLNLVTCAGVWDKVTRSYSKRLVVFTDRVDE